VASVTTEVYASNNAILIQRYSTCNKRLTASKLKTSRDSTHNALSVAEDLISNLRL
jgi:hypothetical protein